MLNDTYCRTKTGRNWHIAVRTWYGPGDITLMETACGAYEPVGDHWQGEKPPERVCRLCREATGGD